MGRRDESSHRPHQSNSKVWAFAPWLGIPAIPRVAAGGRRLDAPDGRMPLAYRMMPAENTTPMREIGVSLPSDRS